MELSTRFNTMLLGFLLSLLAFGDCIAHANDVNGMQVRMNEVILGIDKELGEEHHNSMDVSQTRSKVLGGRKMGVEYYESSMKTGANPNVGKYCGNGMKGKLNIQSHELSVRGLPSNVKAGSLIPINNSDYHAPKTHPPKNN